jgi:hypothetical protein
MVTPECSSFATSLKAPCQLGASGPYEAPGVWWKALKPAIMWLAYGRNQSRVATHLLQFAQVEEGGSPGPAARRHLGGHLRSSCVLVWLTVT